MKRLLPLLLLAALLAACAKTPDYALGTLERERISLPAPVSERIASIAVREGQAVAAGDLLLVLEPERSEARLAQARAELARARAALDEARAGPRAEAIAEARARVRGAEGVALNARREFDRTQAVVRRQLLPVADLDRARASRDSAEASLQAVREQLAALEHGTRGEQLAQAESGLAVAQAQVDALAVDRARTRITAPRAGTVDSLPFEVGDQVPVGTPLAILLVGDRPHARVYLPQALRATVKVGSTATVRLQGSEVAYPAHVRSIRSEPGFTPYYALAGEDASRLSWLAEVELDQAADALPTGMPVRTEFPATQP